MTLNTWHAVGTAVTVRLSTSDLATEVQTEEGKYLSAATTGLESAAPS